MPRFAWSSCLLLGLVFACAGCCQQRVWRCDDGQCSGALSGRYGDGSCGPCGNCGEGPGNCRCGLLQRIARKWTCGEGCGELYWGDWISDPPAPCDPCDECTGEFLGRRCCPPKQRIMLGGRYCDAGDERTSCPCETNVESPVEFVPQPTVASPPATNAMVWRTSASVKP